MKRKKSKTYSKIQILQNAVMYIIDNQIVTLQKSTTMLLNAIGKKAKNNF